MHDLSQCCSKIGKKFVKSLWIKKICNDNLNFTNFHSVRKKNVEPIFAKLHFSEIFHEIQTFSYHDFFRIRLARLYTDAAADVEGLTWPSISSIWHWGGNDLRFKNAFTHFFWRHALHTMNGIDASIQRKSYLSSYYSCSTFVNQRTFVYVFIN